MSGWQAAFAEGVTGFLESLSKARPASDGAEDGDGAVFAPPAHQPQSLLLDPFSWYSGHEEFHHRPTALGWDTLARMAATPLVAAIIQVRTSQVAEFLHAEDNEYAPGFQVRMRARKRSPTRIEQRMAEEIARFLLNCGTYEDPRQLRARDDLEAFGRKITRDSLTYDQACFEVVPTRGSRATGGHHPARFLAVSGKSIRIAQNHDEGHPPPDDDYRVTRYVQVYEEVPVVEYTAEDLAFCVRNPRSDLEMCGYGYSELEMLVRIVTGWLNSFEHNSRFFAQGSSLTGILNLKGQAINERMMRAFKRDLIALTTGVENAHRMPVTSAEGLEFVNLSANNKDMEWSAWSDMLIKLACALYLMDPTEIGFVFGNTGQQAAMGTASAEDRVTTSRERGLHPLVRQLFGWLNRHVVWGLDPDFEVIPTGLRSEAQDLDLDKKRLETSWTIDEIRARRDDEPLPNKRGECVLSPVWIQWAGQQQGGGDDDEDEGAEPIDAAGLFPPEPPEPADETQDAGTGTPPVPQSKPEPLAASLTRRRRVASFIV